MLKIKIVQLLRSVMGFLVVETLAQQGLDRGEYQPCMMHVLKYLPLISAVKNIKLKNRVNMDYHLLSFFKAYQYI